MHMHEQSDERERAGQHRCGRVTLPSQLRFGASLWGRISGRYGGVLLVARVLSWAADEIMFVIRFASSERLTRGLECRLRRSF
jgi:hypothetical protein